MLSQHIDPQIFLTTSTDNDIVFRGDRGDYILGHLAPLPSVDVNCDDIILERLWEEKVRHIWTPLSYLGLQKKSFGTF